MISDCDFVLLCFCFLERQPGVHCAPDHPRGRPLQVGALRRSGFRTVFEDKRREGGEIKSLPIVVWLTMAVVLVPPLWPNPVRCLSVQVFLPRFLPHPNAVGAGFAGRGACRHGALTSGVVGDRLGIGQVRGSPCHMTGLLLQMRI